MKKQSKKQIPELTTYLELNQKFGQGYQARLIMSGIIDSVIDDEPFTLDEAYSGAVFAIEEINKQTGYGYDPYSVIRITGEAIETNRHSDFTTARIAKDIKQGRRELSIPIESDYTKRIVDGEEEIILTGRGTILFTYTLWVDEKLPKAREALRRYCEFLATHRYGESTTNILAELDSMNKEQGSNWIKSTYEKFVTDDATIINFVMSQ